MKNGFHVFVAFVFLIGCTSSPTVKSDKQVFSYNEMNGLSSLDPAVASNFENIWPVNQLFNGLLQLDDSLNVIPAIAYRYNISEDKKTYTFHLRNDVFFHDDPCFESGRGRKVNARDFVYSFNRLFDGKVSSAIALLETIDRSEKNNFQGFKALDDSTLEIHLKQPFSAFASILTMKFFSVLPAEAIERYKYDFRRHPVGTGPFKFKLWEEGTKLILIKNENYFEFDAHHNRLPYLDAITVSFIKDRESAFMELLNGKFDMLSGADAFNINEILDREGNLRDFYKRKFYLQKHTFLKTDYIGILVDENLPQVKNSPLKLKQVRQAINYAFDRDKLIKYLRNNIGEPAHAGFIPKGSKSYDPKTVNGYYYSPDKVKQLLSEAGFPGGKGLPEMTLHITDNYKEQAEFIQSQLAENNIHLQLSVEKPSILRQAVTSSEYNLFKKSWFCDYADEENFMSLFYSKNFVPMGVNFFRYKNSKFDSLYERILIETNEGLKIDMYKKMDSMIIEDAPVIPLYYDEVIRLVSHKISGLGNNAMNLLNLKTVKKQTNN